MNVATLGAHTFGFIWSHSPEAAFDAIASTGCSSVQLMATPPHFDPWRDDSARTKRLRGAIERAGLTLLALDLSSGDVNLASPSVDVAAFSIDAYGRAAVRAAELGAPALCIGSGRRHALFPGSDMRLADGFRRAFATVHDHAARLGVRLVLENHPQGLLARAESIEAFLRSEGYDDVDVIYDVANAFAAGEDPAAGIATLRSRISIIHLSDCPRGGWRHDPIGSGDIDFADVGRALEAIGFASPVVLEIIADDPLRGLADGLAQLGELGWRFPNSRHEHHDGRTAAKKEQRS